MSNTMSYWVLKSGKNNCTYVLDANGKPRSYARDGAVFTNKIDAHHSRPEVRRHAYGGD